jgi:two-component system, NtrC family, sensor kinase
LGDGGLDPGGPGPIFGSRIGASRCAEKPVRLISMISPTERAGTRTIHLALRWMLILATALLLAPPGFRLRPQGFETFLILAFALSNAALSFLPEARLGTRSLEYLTVIADTFLFSVGMFHADLVGSHLPMVFFLTLLLAAIGSDLPRIITGATLVSGLYIYLIWHGPGVDDPGELTRMLLRVPFLYVVSLYYGHMVHRARQDQARERKAEREKRELEAFQEITAATNSTLELREVLLVIVQRIAALVNALRCSILTVDELQGRCTVLVSSDDPKVGGLALDLNKYPEVRKAVETRQTVVINDVGQEPLLQEVRAKLKSLGFQSIMVLQLVFQDNVLGILFLRAARSERRFTLDEITACQVVANASANALRNAMFFEQVRAEARSRKETVDKLQSILDHFPDLVYTTDLEGRLTEFSRGGEGLLGFSRTQALGKTCAELYPEPEARERIAAVIRDGKSLENFETTVRGGDGRQRDVMVTASPLRDETGAVRGTVGIIKDVTELKSARRHLLQAEKLSAVGEVVSGVAHELNNPLAGVLGYAQLLMGGPMDGRQQRSVERIFESALRCQKIVQNLLAFSRRHPSEKRYLGLNGIVEKTLDLKAYQLRVNNLKVVKTLDPDLPRTMMDFNQIQQVLLNVINNAQYAIAAERAQGTLTIGTETRGGAIRLTVSDDGPGMSPETLSKAFDPFFTTKPVGEGTGLGLSVSYGIIREHGGRIWADSRVGEGTTVCIELPIQEDAEATAEETPAGAVEGSAPRRALRILAVDDEPVLLDLITDAMGREGHHVDTAANGREALVKLERGTYDILLLDLKMPDMDGMELFEKIRTRSPDLSRRVIFASGDTVHPETRRFIERAARPCVDKPFKLEVLVAAIAAVANGDGGADVSAGRA